MDIVYKILISMSKSINQEIVLCVRLYKQYAPMGGA